MLKFSHIPAYNKTESSQDAQIRRGGLSDAIERIITNGFNQSLSPDECERYSRFYSEAMEVLYSGDDDEEEIFNTLNGRMLEYRGSLIELYLAHKSISQDKVNLYLEQQWNEAHEWGDSRVTTGDRYFYDIHQNMHGDVSLTQYPLPDKVQGDLFGKQWYTVSNVKGDIISCYQETLGLVTALLRGYILAQLDIGQLERVLNDLSGQDIKGVFAADSGTKEDSVRFYLSSLSRKQVHPKYLGFFVLSYPPSQGYQAAYNSDLKEFELWVVEKTDTGFIEKKMLGIPTIDIPNILKELCILSGRSGSGPRMLISEYIKQTK